MFVSMSVCICVATLALGSRPRQRACKVAGQDGSPGVTPQAFGSVGKCEGMNLHTSKGASTLGVRVPMDCQIFKERLQRSKLNGLKISLYNWKHFGT